jgi:DHA2 family multidrug resistance protein
MNSGTIRGSKVLITLATMLASLMAVLDISIVNVALSDIRASFGTPLDQIAWVSTGYAMANVTIIPISGWFQKRFGFKRYFAGSILIFTAASALCGLAWNLPSLVLFRVLQGLGGGAIIPTSQNILFSRYPPNEHGMAGALFGLGAITGPLLGPTVGGYMIQASSWHWIFYVNLPFGLVAAWLAYTNIEEPDFSPSVAPIDTRGIALLSTGMVSLQYVLEEGNRDGWLDSKVIMALGALAAICLITFVVHEMETANPVVDFRVFANRNYTAATLLNFLIGVALFSGGFLFSLYAGSVMHYTALNIGLLFLKGSFIQIFLMPVVGKLVGRVDSRGLIGLGLAGLVVSLWLNAGLNQTADSRAMLLPVFVRACSLGLCFVPLSVVALSGVPAVQRGNAAGLFNVTRELGGSIGTAWMSTMLDQHSKEYATDMAAKVDIWNPIAVEQLGGLHGIFSGTFDAAGSALSALQGRIGTQALVQAFDQGFRSLAAIFAVSLLVVLVLKKNQPGAAPGAAH